MSRSANRGRNVNHSIGMLGLDEGIAYGVDPGNADGSG